MKQQHVLPKWIVTKMVRIFLVTIYFSVVEMRHQCQECACQNHLLVMVLGVISFDEFMEFAQHEDNLHLFGPLRLKTQKEYIEVSVPTI